MDEAGVMPTRFEPAGGSTVGEACLQAAAYLSEHGIDEGRANAERLLLHLLELEPAGMLRDWRDPFPAGRLAEWGELVTRKAAGEPVQYITGEQWFYGLPFKVTPAVLIPRPETELLVEAVLAAADRLWPGAAGPEPGPGLPAPTVVDIGTGSGAIAVTLAAQRPGWRVCASDLSEEALTVARLNAARHGVSARMAFAYGDLLEPYAAPPADEDGDQAADGAAWQQSEAPGLRIDVLVSNPPYIPVADIDGLQREVRDHEPRLALDGGEDGLAPYRRMLAQVPRLAAPPAIVAFELGQGQAQAVARMLREAGHWDEIRIIKDYAGIERHVLGART